MKNVICLIVAFVVGLLATEAFSQECVNGSCATNSGPVARMVEAPVNLTKQVIAAKPVRKVVGRPLRRVVRFFRCK